MTRDRRASVLLVDDEPDNLVALEAVLEPLGRELVQAASGEEALKLLLKRRVRGDPARRPHARPRRLRDGGADQAARADAPHADHLRDRDQQGHRARLPRLLRGRRRLPAQAVRPGRPALEGVGVRRAATRRRPPWRRARSASGPRSPTRPAAWRSSLPRAAWCRRTARWRRWSAAPRTTSRAAAGSRSSIPTSGPTDRRGDRRADGRGARRLPRRAPLRARRRPRAAGGAERRARCPAPDRPPASS